jgi:hypothetical protein
MLLMPSLKSLKSLVSYAAKCIYLYNFIFKFSRSFLQSHFFSQRLCKILNILYVSLSLTSSFMHMLQTVQELVLELIFANSFAVLFLLCHLT